MGKPVTHSLVRTLRAVPAFATLDDDDLLKIVGTSSNLRWAAGSPIFVAGEAADGLFVVLSGRVGITAEDGTTVAEIGRGDYFGEQSLLLETTRSLSAEALEDCELMVIPTASFHTLLNEYQGLAEHVRRTLESRQAANVSRG